MNSLLRDVRHGARSLFLNPGLSAMSIIALGLGVGITATMFSIVYGALLRGLPFENGDRIYNIERFDVSSNAGRRTPIHDYFQWREQQTTFEELGAFTNLTATIAGTDHADRYPASMMTASTLRLVGVAPHLGRLFTEEEDDPGADPVMLIGYNIWRDRFASDPGVVGEVVRVNGEQTTIIGVMPEGFHFPVTHDAWLPLKENPTTVARGEGNWYYVVGLLRDDRSLAEARTEFEGIAAQIAAEFPDNNENLSARVESYTKQYIGEEASTMLWTMLGAVSFVLLIACANVANLLVSRAFDRTKEVAIRTALGAGRARIVRQILVETALLATAGAFIGIGMAMVGVDWFNDAIAGTGAPFFIDIRVDAPILLFVLGATTLATLFASTLPALQVMRGNLNDVLTDESRGTSSFRMGRISRGLVMAQVALSCALLVAAGLMIRSVVNLGTIDYGFDTDGVLTGRVTLTADEYPDVASRELYFDRLYRDLTQHPGVEAATMMTSLPVSEPPNRPFLVEGEVRDEIDDRRDANVASITPGVFDTFEQPLIGGRDFNAADTRDGLPVVIVNETFVARYLEGRDPLGARIEFVPTGGEERRWHTVVGVAPDLFMDGAQNESPDGMYVPLDQSLVRSMSVAVRTRAETSAFIPELRRAVLAINPDTPVFDILTMSARIREQTWFYWVFGSLFGVFGGIALLLASVGLYGVMAFSVRRRTAEVGIRMALGADTPGVLKLVLRQGLFQLGVGLAVGMLMATGLANLLEALLFNVEPGDPSTFAAIVATLLVTGLVATLIPARRAARTDPMIALRKQ